MFTYDDVYREPGFYWGKEPNLLCEQALTFLGDPQGKSAIDLGCGEGRDLIRFAQGGCRVTGVDISRPGLLKAERWAAEEGLTVRTVQASLVDYRLDEPHDLVYASGALTYLPPSVRPEAIANYQRFTRAGGIHAFNVFVEKPFIATAPDWGADEYFYRTGELLSYYWDWEILLFEEFTFDCHSSGVPHQHAMDVMIARKVVP